MKYDLLVFIGRFQPFHNGHKSVIDTALDNATNVLVLVGSSGSHRNIRNPFTFEERSEMIKYSFHCNSRIIVKPIYDMLYNDSAWIKQIQDQVTSTALDIANNGGFRTHGLNDVKVGLIGASKDHTSYYLKMFPQWESIDVSLDGAIHATDIREDYLATGEVDMVPRNVKNYLENYFYNLPVYKQLQREYDHVQMYKESWEAAPYPVKHITVDAVVEQGGHILLVKRKAEPGRGLWALPGGHLEVDETLATGVIRELKEETGIKVPVPVLKGSVVNSHIFDSPHRSTLGRVITYAQHIRLENDIELPKVKGADDAEKAVWLPIGELREDQMFDDHFAIINYFLGL